MSKRKGKKSGVPSSFPKIRHAFMEVRDLGFAVRYFYIFSLYFNISCYFLYVQHFFSLKFPLDLYAAFTLRPLTVVLAFLSFTQGFLGVFFHNTYAFS